MMGKIPHFQKIRLAVKIRSHREPSYEHPIGANGWIVEILGPHTYLIELRVPDPTLIGDAWYEVFDVYDHEIEIVSNADG